MDHQKKIGIIGAGWLGFPLAKRFVENGYLVYATTTQEQKIAQLSSCKIQAAIYSDQGVFPNWLKELDWCIIDFPPRKSVNYAEQVSNLVKNLSATCQLIFTSSTGVYPQESGIVNEESPIDQTHVVASAEKVIQQSNRNWYVLRLAGLVGQDRNPIHFLSGREVDNAQYFINLVHQADCIEAIERVVEECPSSQVFNIVCPFHPSKEEYYTAKATQLGLVPPVFKQGESLGKIVDGSKMVELTSFNYRHKP